MNKLIITGRLGRDATTRHLDNGKTVASFSVAVDSGWGDNKKTIWYDCSLWGKRAEGKLIEHLQKGKQVGIEGEPELNTYTSNDGEMKASIRVFVTDLELLGSRETSPPQSAPAQQPAGSDLGDDVPF